MTDGLIPRLRRFGDGGMGDGPPPNVVSLNPPLLEFGDVTRGQASSVHITTVVNNTSKTWMIGTHTRDLSQEEIAKGAREFAMAAAR